MEEKDTNRRTLLEADQISSQSNHSWIMNGLLSS